MSLSTLTRIAVQRDTGAPKIAKKKSTPGSEVVAQERGYLSSLAAAIPTEPLALYTFVVAMIVSTIESGGDKRLVMRWAIYAAMILVIVLWLGASYVRNSDPGKKKRSFPWLETASAVTAFAAWGLAMPESPLNAALSSNNRTIWTAIITAAGVLLLGMLGTPLKEEVKAKRPKQGKGKGGGQQAPAKPPAGEHQVQH